MIVSNVSKSFKQGGEVINALNLVSFKVGSGEIVSIVGPDGSGKTTLLRIVAGLLKQDNGEINFEEDSEHIAYMPQKFGLYEDLTVEENLDLYADLKGVGKKQREERYQELLKMANLEDFRERLVGNLSGGMKQKLGLICTLVSPPKLLLLDEPTVGVDPLSRNELWEILLRLSKKNFMSVLLSTSYLDEAARCDEVVLLFEGKMLASGKPDELCLLSKDMSYLAFLKQGDTPRSLQAKLLGTAGIIDALP